MCDKARRGWEERGTTQRRKKRGGGSDRDGEGAGGGRHVRRGSVPHHTFVVCQLGVDQKRILPIQCLCPSCRTFRRGGGIPQAQPRSADEGRGDVRGGEARRAELSSDCGVVWCTTEQKETHQEGGLDDLSNMTQSSTTLPSLPPVCLPTHVHARHSTHMCGVTGRGPPSIPRRPGHQRS